MSEKIEMFWGWDWDGTLIVGSERNGYIKDKCTVVVHDDKSERVYTESEVRAALSDVMALGFTRDEKCNILKDVHGIVLDPE